MADREFMTSQQYSATIGGTVYNVSVGMSGAAPTSGYYVVTAYGATGDGATDDTTAIQNCINAAELTGGVVVFPYGNYLVSSTLTCDYNDANQHLAIDAYGARIFANSGLAGPVLEIGSASASTLNVIVNGGHWGMGTRDWTSTVGINLKAANRCVLRDVMVENCEVGIQLEGNNGRGTAYNTIAARRIVDCETGIYLTGSTDSWANSNKFYDTAIQYTSALDAVDCSGGWAINLETPTNGEHIFNDNHFHGLTMEIASTHTAGKPGAVRVFGEQNTFVGLRIERFTEPLYVGVSGTIDAGAYYAQRNKIITGYTLNHAYTNLIKDDTGNERLAFDLWANQEKVFYGGSASYPILGLRASSSGYKGFEIYDAGQTTPSYAVSSGGDVTVGNATKRVVGSGTPEGSVTAPVGSVYQRTDGGSGTSLYVKESGSGNTGWQAVSSASANLTQTWALPRGAGAGTVTHYVGGFYTHSGTASDFSLGPTWGVADDEPYAAHFFVVLGAATVDELTLTVTGTTIDDNGTRTASAAEDIVIPNATSADAYFETSAKYLGQVVITVKSGTAKTCDYGWAKYWDNLNTDFTVTGLEMLWEGGANGAIDARLRHHKTTGWTYTGTGATPPTAIASLDTDYGSTEVQTAADSPGAWKRTNLSTSVSGSAGEGVILEVDTNANGQFRYGQFTMNYTTG